MNIGETNEVTGSNHRRGNVHKRAEAKQWRRKLGNFKQEELMRETRRHRKHWSKNALCKHKRGRREKQGKEQEQKL